MDGRPEHESARQAVHVLRIIIQTSVGVACQAI